MSNNEAKFMLGAYRPNGRDADDALFAPALSQVKNDPALGAWFARAQAHDAAMAARLAEIAPPAGLREAILAGARASRSPQPARRFPTMWLAMAASLAVLLAATVALRPSRAAAETSRLASMAINDTANGRHGGHGEATGALAAMLSQPSTRLGAELPVDFAALRATGCRTVSFAGHDVLEVCFQRNAAWFHCYIMNRADFPALTAGTAASFAEEAKFAAVSWSGATHHFVVVSEAGLDAVRRLL